MNKARSRWMLPLFLLALTTTAKAQDAQQQRIDEQTAVLRALRTNPSRQAALLDVEKAQQDVYVEEGRYPYIYQADAGYTRTVAPRLQSDDSVTATTQRLYTVGQAIRRTFPFGTTAEFRVQGERVQNDSSFSASSSSAGSTFVPGATHYWGVTGRATLTQPLMRGFGTVVGEAELRAARVSKTAAQKSRDRISSELARDALTAYWELWYADESIRIDQAALELAKEQEKQADAKVKAGALAPADALSFSTRVASLEESVVASDTTKRQKALDLARLMGSTDENAEFLTASSAPPAPGPPTSRAEIEAAVRAGSVELAELEAQVKLARTRAEAAGDASRPRLDLEAYIESTGLSERVPPAFERAGEMKWITTHVGVVFELPLDDSRRRAQKASALLAVRIAEHDLKAARDKIGAEAALSVTNETASVRKLALAERTLELAQKTYEAEKARFELGNSVPITVQLAEDEVRKARQRVARARVDVVQAQIASLHLSGKLLPRYGLST